MDIKLITKFFIWCTIINVALLLLSTAIYISSPELFYNTHGKWFAIPNETINVILYSWLGLYELLIYIFNVVPLIALLIIGGKES